MTLVDSSGWLEFLADGPLARRFAPFLEDLDAVLTPTVIVLEVYKVIKRARGEDEALLAVAQLQKTRIVELDTEIALTAADLSLEHRLAMADAIVYATARVHAAEVVTSDADFEGLPGVRFFTKKR